METRICHNSGKYDASKPTVAARRLVTHRVPVAEERWSHFSCGRQVISKKVLRSEKGDLVLGIGSDDDQRLDLDSGSGLHRVDEVPLL